MHNGIAIIDNRQGYIMDTYGTNESYFIQFGGTLAEKYCQMLLGGERYREYQINWRASLVESFEQLVLLYRQPSNNRRDVYACMLITQILSKLFLGSDSYQPLYAENAYVKSTLRIMEDRFSQPLKLKDIADELHINSSYLSRLIARETGISFSACLSYVRINHAKKELFHGTAPFVFMRDLFTSVYADSTMNKSSNNASRNIW